MGVNFALNRPHLDDVKHPRRRLHETHIRMISPKDSSLIFRLVGSGIVNLCDSLAILAGATSLIAYSRAAIQGFGQLESKKFFADAFCARKEQGARHALLVQHA